MACLTKEHFSKPVQLPTERYDLPELGGYVCVRSLTARQLHELQTRQKSGNDTGNLDFAAEVLSRTLVDDAGALLFADGAEVVEHLNLPLPTLQALCEKALALSGIPVGSDEKN